MATTEVSTSGKRYTEEFKVEAVKQVVDRAEVARINADFGEDNFSDAGVPMRVSDHDPVVMYFHIK